MEGAKDQALNINYTSIKEKKTSIIRQIFKRSKFIQLIVGMTVILGITNVILIYNFFSMLSKI
mgnify:CR=1 FL=1